VAAKEIAKDKIICSEGQPFEASHIIASGSVRASFNGCEIILRKGEIIGLLDAAYDSHSFTYTTLEPCSFISIPVKNINAVIPALVNQNPDVAKRLCLSMINQVSLVHLCYLNMKKECRDLYAAIMATYEEYMNVCSKNGISARAISNYEILGEVPLENDVESWLFPYYEALKELAVQGISRFAAKADFLKGFINKASEDIHSTFQIFDDMNEYLNENSALFLQENRLDLFDMYTSMSYRLGPASSVYSDVTADIEKMIIFLKKSSRISDELISERVSEYRVKASALSSTVSESGEELLVDPALMHAVDTIVDYSGVDEEVGAEFKSLLSKYKALPDKLSSTDTARKLRSDLTASFHTIYEEAFTMSLFDSDMPMAVKMFFNFGFVDVDLAGVANTNMLYRLAKDFKGDPENGIYTAYEWFMAIFKGEKEPSRNSLDLTYSEFLHDQKINGKITAEIEERMLNDAGQRTLFELQNMFPTVNKTTYGRLSTYCPVFCEADVIKPLGSCLVSSEILLDAINKIEAVDYSVFYRDTMFTYNMGSASNNEVVSVRVKPNIILLPNIGSRAVMWQEIEGKKRTTPARFMISVFHVDDLLGTIAKVMGEYRWEMCKRVQGARWNDITERSLTSEYCDYAQFYKKNSDLSQDAKEKVKIALTRSRNSFKDMFVRDYIVWVTFESKGSQRLNKVSRQILSTYCPFKKSTRAKLASNPIFGELFEKNAARNNQKLHRLDNIITKLKSLNQPVPAEIELLRSLIDGDIE